jgi:glycerol-3-phosphate acyltransferase PlsY
LETIILLCIGYFLGSIPFALWIGRSFYGIDVSKEGSGNLGATNVFRVLGKVAGAYVLLLDISKGVLATALPLIFNSSTHPLLVGAAAIVGHSLSIFIRFKGGKSVATTAGVLLFYQPLFFILILAIFVVTLKISKYVSLSSIIASLSAAVLSLFMGDLWFSIMMFAFAIFIVYRHRKNITRIQVGSEPKIKW